MPRSRSTPSKGYRYQTLMSAWERAAIEFLREKHGSGISPVNKADAVRYALRRQIDRDGREDNEARVYRCYADARVRVAQLSKGKGARSQNGENVEVMLPLTILFSAADLQALDGIASRHKLAHRAEAIRYVVRVQASLEGFKGPAAPAPA